MTATLPPELIDVIISYVERTADLKSCTLVSSLFLPRARHSLFVSIQLFSNTNIRRFARQIEDVSVSPRLSNFHYYITSLHVKGLSNPDISLSLPNLISLSVSTSSFYRLRSFPCELGPLRILTLTDVFFSAPILLEVLAGAKCLQQLKLHFVEVSTSEYGRPPPLFQLLECIELVRGDGVIRLVLDATVSVESLWVDWFENAADLRPISDIISRSRECLKDLTISMCPYDMDISPQDIVLAICPDHTFFPVLSLVSFTDIVFGTTPDCTHAMNAAIPTILRRLLSSRTSDMVIKFDIHLAGVPLPVPMSDLKSFNVADVQYIGWPELSAIINSFHKPPSVIFELEVSCDGYDSDSVGRF